MSGLDGNLDGMTGMVTSFVEDAALELLDETCRFVVFWILFDSHLLSILESVGPSFAPSLERIVGALTASFASDKETGDDEESTEDPLAKAANMEPSPRK